MPRTLTDEDVEAVARRVTELFDARLSAQVLPEAENDRFLSGPTVMKRLGFRTRSAFWQFVHGHGLPCFRLGPCRIVFDRQQLEDWISRRSTTPVRSRR